MHFKTIVAASLPVFGALAAPKPQTDSMSFAAYESHPSCSCPSSAFGVTTTTLSLTLTVTSTHTFTASSATATSSGPVTTPTSAYGLMSARSASPVHLLPWSAAGLRFYLGGNTAAYCPTSVGSACPPGNTTAFLGTCSMDVEVPGGQQIYVTPSGEIGYTQAHSVSRPVGANLCPFSYSRPADSQFGYVTLDPAIAFGATGFMACPTDSGYYQVFANLQNATVPKGDPAACLGFNALAPDFTGSPAAWQYI